jgi:hypothetical protein
MGGGPMLDACNIPLPVQAALTQGAT